LLGEIMSGCSLDNKHCKPCEGGIEKFSREQALALMPQLKDWHLNAEATELSKRFEFKGFQKVMFFVNAVAWIAQQEMHHPDIKFGYNYCEIVFTTHAISGLSENDFICVAKINGLFV